MRLRLFTASVLCCALAAQAQTPGLTSEKTAAVIATESAAVTSTVDTGANRPLSNTTSAKDRLLPLEVFVNQAKGGTWALLERNGILYAPAEAFEEWRLSRRAAAQAIEYQGQPWYALSSIAGFQAKLNFADQSIDLSFSPSAFDALRQTREVMQRPPLSRAIPAVFANYDLNYSRARSRSSGGATSSSTDLSALTELGTSGEWGLLTSSYVGRNLVSQDAQTRANWHRLETTYTHNFLSSNTSLRLGDSATRTGSSGRAIYFGGLQLSRNFLLQPGFISQPIPVVNGLSTSASTMDLYINNVLRQTSQVPAGPFSIENFPSISGAGEARVVVRDILGRETIINQAFFSHPSLLAQDLSDWSFELGAVRRNLGNDNANYGPRFASGLWRQGLSQSLTAEGQGEWSAALQRLSLGASYALPWQMLGQTALSLSHSSSIGKGQNWLASAERSGQQHSFTLSAQGASRNYRQLGIDIDSYLPRRQSSASYSLNGNRFGAFSLGYTSYVSYDRGRLDTVNLSYNLRLGERSALSLTASKLYGFSSGYSVGVTLIVPLERGVTLSSGLSQRSGAGEAYISANRALSAETGWGWQTTLRSRANAGYAEGGAYYQGGKGLLSADLSGDQNQQNMRLGLTGGAVIADGQWFASRRVEDSFAIVEVAGYANVGVGFQGNTLTRTNADGVALLPRLQPYQSNRVQLDASELPISAELDSIEQEAVPAQRSAVKISFPVRTGRGALIRIVLDDGEPAPAGATLELMGDQKDQKEFFVARRGEAFITGLQTQNRLTLKWNASSCRFEVLLPAGNLDEIPRVGPVVCSGVKR